MFVCLGNICRSPMAEYIFKSFDVNNQFEVSSSGISNEEYGTDLLNDIKLYDDSLEEYWAKENALNGVVGLIDQLPENQQTIVRKRFFKDLSFKEIAEEEGISINTALGRMRYALINLKKLAVENKIFMAS